jgi:TPR repeat protein
MSTLSGKPANPVDLSTYAPRKAGERIGGERYPVENDHDPLRSPYAPKEAWRRAAAPSDPADDTTTDAAPLAPTGAPDGVREPPGRHAVDADESRLCPDDAPDSGWPGSEEEDARDHSLQPSFDEDDASSDPGEAASLQPSDPVSSGRHEQPAAPRRDAVMSDYDLERLETSLRWLQRQEASTRLPPAPTLPPGPGLASLDSRGRRHGGDRFASDFRSPLSLEPERMAPPPAMMSGRSNLRWSLYIFIASAVVASSAYYLSAGGFVPPSEPVAPPKLASADSSPAPAPAAGRQELVGKKQSLGNKDSWPTVARDDDPEALRELAAQSLKASKTAQLTAKLTAKTPAKSSEGDTVAMLAPPVGAAPAPAPSNPIRTLDAEEIALLIKQGEQFIAAGDVVAARTIFQRAAEAGDAHAAMALGASYDPAVLAKLGVLGMGADVDKARSWYQKAESLGSQEATQRLSVLANR